MNGIMLTLMSLLPVFGCEKSARVSRTALCASIRNTSGYV